MGSWINSSARNQLPGCENTQVARWRSPYGEELRPINKASEKEGTLTNQWAWATLKCIHQSSQVLGWLKLWHLDSNFMRSLNQSHPLSRFRILFFTFYFWIFHTAIMMHSEEFLTHIYCEIINTYCCFKALGFKNVLCSIINTKSNHFPDC